MSDELPPLPEFPQSKAYAFGPVEQQWVREYATAYASEAVLAAVERERAGWFRSLASAGDAQAKAEPDNTHKWESGELGLNLAHAKSVSKEEEALVEAALKAEPVAWMALCDGVAVQTAFGRPALDAAAKTNRWEIVPLYAHPPTSEWNDAIEAAADIVATAIIYRDANTLPEIEAQIRALKREPR